jgi:hypothetical protein
MFTDRFEDYLQHQYHEPSGRGVFADVADFFRRHPNPESIADYLDILRIKFLTKIASHAVDAEWELRYGINYPSDTLEAAIRYCRAGIEFAQSGKFECFNADIKKEDAVKMHGHFYSHMAKLERILAERSQNPDEKKKLLSAAKNHLAESMRICQQIDTEHAAYQFMFQSKVALELSELCTGDEQRSFIIEAAKGAYEGARRSEQFNPLHSGHQYTFASDEFYRAALMTPDGDARNELITSAFEAGIKGAEMVRQEDTTHWAITCGNIGKFAEALFESTNDHKWKNEAIKHYTLLRDYMRTSGKNWLVMRAMNKKIQDLQSKRNTVKIQPAAKERQVETKFIKRPDERHKTRKHIRDELGELGY